MNPVTRELSGWRSYRKWSALEEVKQRLRRQETEDSIAVAIAGFLLLIVSFMTLFS